MIEEAEQIQQRNAQSCATKTLLKYLFEYDHISHADKTHHLPHNKRLHLMWLFLSWRQSR